MQSPPFAKIPADQVDEYFALAAVQNIGVEEQHNVQIHHTVKKEGSNEIVEDQTISVGNLPALFHDTTKWFFPDPVNIPAETENYIGTYNVTQDEIDSDTSDNHIEYHFTVGGSTFAHEDGPTRSFNFQQSSVFIKTEAWGYGNVFYPVKDVAVRGLTFGAVLDESLPGDSINLNLIEWHDQNNDQIAQTSERILVGTGRYYFDETTGWIVTTVPLENIAEPGSQIVMSGGKIYFAMMEYLSNDISNKGKVKMLASEERNFVPTVAAFDSAYVHGLTDRRRYMSVLQFSPDGVISNVDFFVRPLVPWPNLHPGDHIVPMLRIETEFINSAQNVFASDMISVFPNPTQDFIRISIDPDLNADIMDISIGDMMGRIIQHFPDAQLYDGKYQIDIRGLADGVYTIVIHTGNQVYNKPVIVF